MGEVYLREDFARRWQHVDPFVELERLATPPVRAVAQRRTFRFELDGRGYYAKVHHGVGWPEIFKNLLMGKAPVLDASNEFRAVQHLTDVGIATLRVAAFGTQGTNPARRHSFLVTDEIDEATTLEDLTLHWSDRRPAVADKWELIDAVADLAGTMHRAGINHRDFYLCHLLVRSAAGGARELLVMDLHRAQHRPRVPRRWLVRDLAGLYYSSLDIGLTRTDVCRFLSRYYGVPLRDVFRKHGRMLATVAERAARLYQKAQRKGILPRQLYAARREPSQT